MDSLKPFGLYLLKKERKDLQALRDLLQLLKSNSSGRKASFAYVEAENSLLPHLSLWENLQLITGHSRWEEFVRTAKSEWILLIRLITHPERIAAKAENWEKFTISLLKGIISEGHLLIDMNEDVLSPLIIQNLKRTIISVANEKQIYLASATSSLWLDCAHSLVSKKEYKFITQQLDQGLIKRHWAV
jgi:ABC-type branched-subunit amino acid transport system ATPase component